MFFLVDIVYIDIFFFDFFERFQNEFLIVLYKIESFDDVVYIEQVDSSGVGQEDDVEGYLVYVGEEVVFDYIQIGFVDI